MEVKYTIPNYSLLSREELRLRLLYFLDKHENLVVENDMHHISLEIYRKGFGIDYNFNLN